MIDKQVIPIKFKNLKDFRERMAGIWQNQEENTVYDLIFPNEETEEEFKKIIECFKNEHNHKEIV